MTYLNIEISVLRNDAMTDATSAQKGAWLSLIAYCIEQENSGRIKGFFGWSDLKIAKAVGLTKNELFEACSLWFRDGDDLRVEFYPKEKQRLVQAKRRSAHAAALARWGKRAKSDSTSDTSASSDDASDDASDDVMRKGMEEKGREGNRNTPLPPLEKSAEEQREDRFEDSDPEPDQPADEQPVAPVGAEVPGDDEVVAWAKAWVGDLARAIPGPMPEVYVLNWLAWRTTPKAGPWPRDWRSDLQRRFVRDWLDGNPRARGNAQGGTAPAAGSMAYSAQVRALEEQIADHPGNPGNTRGSTETKKARRPEFNELCNRLKAMKTQLVG